MVNQDGVDDACHAIDGCQGIGDLASADVLHRHDQFSLRPATVNLHAGQRQQPLLYRLHPVGTSLDDEAINVHGSKNLYALFVPLSQAWNWDRPGHISNPQLGSVL